MTPVDRTWVRSRRRVFGTPGDGERVRIDDVRDEGGWLIAYGQLDSGERVRCHVIDEDLVSPAVVYLPARYFLEPERVDPADYLRDL